MGVAMGLFDWFKTAAKSVGLDQAEFGKCFDERRHLESIFQDRQEANRWGFHGTPGFILMQTAAGPTEKVPAIAIPGAFPFDAFASANNFLFFLKLPAGVIILQEIEIGFSGQVL